MSLLSRIFGQGPARSDYRPLYERVVAIGRDPCWYREGEVPDTLDGRFDMIAAILALVLLRMEREGTTTSQASAMMAELFIEDMEGSVRQIGIGDLMVGKQVGSMMGALGGRLSVFRAAVEGGRGFQAPVVRNIFHDSPPSDAAVTYVSERLGRFQAALAATPIAELLSGEVPKP